MHENYIQALRAERAHFATYGKTDRVAEVDAELARVGHAPAAENAAESAPVERTVTPRKTTTRRGNVS